MRQLRSLGASVLVQDVDAFVSPRAEWQAVTKRQPTDDEWRDLVLAWRVCGRTTSNAIAVVTNGQAVGVGAGQQSRVVAAEIAVQKAGERAKGGAGASDAFFPFPDGLLVLADAGVTAVVQPGGSVKDGEVIAAADEAGLAMVMTGERHFRTDGRHPARRRGGRRPASTPRWPTGWPSWPPRASTSASAPSSSATTRPARATSP